MSTVETLWIAISIVSIDVGDASRHTEYLIFGYTVQHIIETFLDFQHPCGGKTS